MKSVLFKCLALISAGIAHASFGSVALEFLLGVNWVVSAAVFCLCTAWAIIFSNERTDHCPRRTIPGGL
ncbi:MAG: metal ABC transporter permease [Deltaproteobacteria bacterium]|nr:metal ABC transporter permease [Deltaproteobacteria bacterium]